MTELELKQAKLTRQLDLINSKCLDVPITVIGAGAIGSFTVLSLAKMGFEDITVWDNDDVDIENMNCQFYPTGSVGNSKVYSLSAMVQMFTDVLIKYVDRRFTSDDKVDGGIVIVTVDSMKARSEIWEVIKGNSGVSLYIDSRMSAETALMYCFDPAIPSKAEMYEKTLYSDSDAMSERCTAKSTIYTVLGITSQICATVKAQVMSLPRLKTLQWDFRKFECAMFTEGRKNGDD